MRRTSVFLVVVLAMAGSAAADVPQMINYQGHLRDSTGAPLDTTVSMEFAIYDDSTGGVPLWVEMQGPVTVSGGAFSVMLGEMVPIDGAVFSGPERWLAIKVGDDPELAPKTRLASVGYAFRVSTVDGSTGGIISGDVSIQSDLVVSGKATIGPGHSNTGAYAFVAGSSNAVDDEYGVVSGGWNNSAGPYGAVGGGEFNDATGHTSAIMGGESNSITGNNSFIGGGDNNTVNGAHAVIAGGCSLSADGDFATVGGGFTNSASGHSSTLGGGAYNSATGDWSMVGGGIGNVASGPYSTVIGGSNNAASGEQSMTCGGEFNLSLIHI